MIKLYFIHYYNENGDNDLNTYIKINMLDKLFYIIHSAYYKHGKFKNDIPSLTVGGIFSISFFCIGLSCYGIVGWLNPTYWSAPKLSKLSIGLILWSFVGLTYILL